MSGDTVTLHGEKVELAGNEGRQFITDVCRTAESLQTDEDLRRQYDISPQEWGNIVESKPLIKALRAERDRRIRNGQAARELAAKHHATAPNVLNEILTDKGASPRHRIESAKELRATATSSDGADAASTGAKFEIRIDLSAGGNPDDIIVFSGPMEPMKPLTPVNAPLKEVE